MKKISAFVFAIGLIAIVLGVGEGPFVDDGGELIGIGHDAFAVFLAAFAFEGDAVVGVEGVGGVDAHGLEPSGELRNREDDGEDAADDEQRLNPRGFGNPTPEFGDHGADRFDYVHSNASEEVGLFI